MKKKILIFAGLIFFVLVLPVKAVIKDEQIYTAFQEMLDREPDMDEYHFYIKDYKGYDFVKKSLNQTEERKDVIKNIYQRALKRNPRADETETLVRFIAPNNLIRKQLFESEERKLAIIDAYQKFLGRNPSDDDLAFYVKTRSPFEKIKEVLNSSEERKIVLADKYLIVNGQSANPNELSYMIENMITLGSISQVKVLGIEHVEPIKKEGPVKIVFFNDFECVYCGDFYKTIKRVENYFSGKVEIIIKNFPLPFHENSLKASMAYECAVEQGFGEKMSEGIYNARIAEDMSVENWKKIAETLDLDSDKFNNCLDGDKYLDKIKNDFSEGESLGVTGTPTVLIEGEKILGSVDFDILVKIVEKHL